jgi:ABC-type sugar transport system permease subunit
MSEEGAELDQQPSRSEAAKLRTYRIRMSLLGFAVLILSLFAGLAMSFYEWDRGSPFDTSTWNGHFNPITRATYAPLAFMILIFPITLHVLLILALPIYFGLKKKRLWPLALVGYLAAGVLWLFCLDGLWQMD